MKPYNPQKVEKANELYEKLSDKFLDIDEIDTIESQIEELYKS